MECRSSGGVHTIVISLPNDIASGIAGVTTGTGTISSGTVSGNAITLNLMGVADVQHFAVTLYSVTDTFGQVLPDTAVSMNVLAGDTNGTSTVNATDIGQTKAQSGMPVTSANFRQDVTPTGAIHASDIGTVKASSGHTLP